MTLGGYIFKGYKFELPADYDATVDAQVIAQCLRLHKMKLKAFMESCTASGANWQFFETNGEISYESYGNVIYKLDESGFNYASFFRYGSDNAYYCMLTLSDAGFSTSGFSLSLQNYYYVYIGATRYGYNVTNSMDSIGIEPITRSNLFSTSTDAMYHRLSFTSIYSAVITSYTSTSKSVSNNQYIGYVTKGKSIIVIETRDLTQSSYFKILSIDSLELASNTDTSNMFSLTTNSQVSQYITGNYFPGRLAINRFVQVSGNNGLPYEFASHTYNTSISPYVATRSPQRAICIGVNNHIPFEPVVFSTLMGRKDDKIINSDGIPTKGSVDISLLATNIVVTGQYDNSMDSVLLRKPFGGGNYLCIHKTVSTSNSHPERKGIVYCGWDSTNPDIRIPDAWPVYNG